MTFASLVFDVPRSTSHSHSHTTLRPGADNCLGSPTSTTTTTAITTTAARLASLAACQHGPIAPFPVGTIDLRASLAPGPRTRPLKNEPAPKHAAGLADFVLALSPVPVGATAAAATHR
ncbi:hypothetical protein CMUS01_06540 [Colletotrichum musicola]|uniref:Uncharacterized protein n=1 Tax=Colletotrichum musicola TaxID=2175873 RepID=A0A8H6NIA8_9PEZI|nr:hypothetical protein CMUS01_06540 [Colletotrichum musicola]